VFTGTVGSTAINNSGLIATGSFTDNGAAVFGSSGYVQINSLTPSQCVNTASNDVLGSQPCNYFTLNGLQPTVSLTSTGSTLSVTPSGSTIDLEVIATPNPAFVTSLAANAEKISRGDVAVTTSGTIVNVGPYSTSGSYTCTATPEAGTPVAENINVSRTSSSSITISTSNNITVGYICVGH
jgi:hypothetical protein